MRRRSRPPVAAVGGNFSLAQAQRYVWFVMRPYEAGIVRDLRVIPGRTGVARRAVTLYERRLAFIDDGLSAWQQGKQRRALSRFDSAQALSLPLSRLFEAIQASACEPA